MREFNENNRNADNLVDTTQTMDGQLSSGTSETEHPSPETTVAESNNGDAIASTANVPSEEPAQQQQSIFYLDNSKEAVSRVFAGDSNTENDDGSDGNGKSPQEDDDDGDDGEKCETDGETNRSPSHRNGMLDTENTATEDKSQIASIISCNQPTKYRDLQRIMSSSLKALERDAPENPTKFMKMVEVTTTTTTTVVKKEVIRKPPRKRTSDLQDELDSKRRRKSMDVRRYAVGKYSVFVFVI